MQRLQQRGVSEGAIQRALVVGALLALVACGGDDGDSTPGTGMGNSPVIPGSDAGAATPGGPGGQPGNPPVSNDAGGATPPNNNTQGKPSNASDAGTPVDSAAPSEDGAWCKVQPLFAKYCTSCHDGKGTAGAPMALLTYADLTADSAQYPGSKIYQRAGIRMHATTKKMPPQGEVSAADQKAIDDWISAKAPSGGNTTCAAANNPGDAGSASADWPADCEEHHKFLANAGTGKPFQVGAGQEFYQDFTFQVPWDGDVQAVQFREVIDNPKVIHHWILYQGSSSFLVGWSPGKVEKPFPSDIGVHMPGKGATLKLTNHYYNKLPGAKAETDASGVEVCITRKKRPKTAFTFPFAATPNVPANAPMTTNKATCTVQTTDEVHLITSSPHMHKRGIHAKFEVQRTNGMVEVIHDKPFDFEEQTTWPIDVILKNGDKVTTTCIYKNDGLPATGFGLNTDQEMCFNFAYYYPMCALKCTGGEGAIWTASQGGGCPTGGGAFGI